MRYDVHAHAFHPKIAAKTLVHLEQHYGISPIGTGLLEDLLERERRAGVDRVVVHSAATTPVQVRMANDWAMTIQRENMGVVVAFGTLHPDLGDWLNELELLKAAGIKGLKFHPEFQGFWLDDPRLKDIMEASQNDFVFM